ncbi:hypothetical protein PFISCL1PPCAC_28800 [Pristionchus fissidentatus]|nr:hypothetical protein PFISCL1PPCAC_28800 [Pristionchus fissidentatus]
MDDILKEMVDNETLFQTLENTEREEAMEAEQNSRDSMGGPSMDFSLDIPMHEETPSSLESPLTRQSFLPPPSTPFFNLPQATVLTASQPLLHKLQIPLMAANTQRESRERRDSRHENPPAPPPTSLPSTSLPPPSAPLPAPLMSLGEPQQRNMMADSERKHSRVNEVPESSSRNGSFSSLPKSRLADSSPTHTPSQLPPVTVGPQLGTIPKLSSLGRIPKKGQPPSSSQPLDSSPSLPTKTTTMQVPVNAPPKAVEPIRISRGKIAPTNDGRRDSVDSQDTMRAESMGESDCGMTESEDNESVFKTDRGRDKSRDHDATPKSQHKGTWDELFDDAPATVDESNKEKKKREAQERENKRRLEMKEMEKKKEREKRRKKDDERRPDRTREERDRHDKRSTDDRRRESRGDEKDEREREKEREERMKEREREEKQKKIEMKRKEQEDQKKIIETALKRQNEIEERARQKKKEEDDRKRELKEREDERRREKEREEEKKRETKEKKEEEEKMKKERENKAKEERRNELERRRRKEMQMKKQNERFIPLSDSPLDKIAAEMDGKEIRKENEHETATPASSRVMEISSGMERHRSSSMMGSLHSSKTGIYLEKAQRLRDSNEKEKGITPEVSRQTRRPIRIQMAPVKRPPPPAITSDEEEEEGEGETEKTPSHKKGRLEDKRIDNVLNKLYR